MTVPQSKASVSYFLREAHESTPFSYVHTFTQPSISTIQAIHQRDQPIVSTAAVNSGVVQRIQKVYQASQLVSDNNLEMDVQFQEFEQLISEPAKNAQPSSSLIPRAPSPESTPQNQTGLIQMEEEEKKLVEKRDRDLNETELIADKDEAKEQILEEFDFDFTQSARVSEQSQLIGDPVVFSEEFEGFSESLESEVVVQDSDEVMSEKNFDQEEGVEDVVLLEEQQSEEVMEIFIPDEKPEQENFIVEAAPPAIEIPDAEAADPVLQKVEEGGPITSMSVLPSPRTVQDLMRKGFRVSSLEEVRAKHLPFMLQGNLVLVDAEDNTSAASFSSRTDVSTGRTFTPGRLIVKFKKDWPHGLDGCAHCIHASGQKFQSFMMDGSASIDQLNALAQVSAINEIGMERHGMSSAEALSYQDRIIKRVKARFPERTQRAPKDARIPDLTNTYVIEVDKNADVIELCQLYEDDPHVAYASPAYQVRLSVFPQDPPDDPLYLPLQYNLDNRTQTGGTADADIDMPEAWPVNLGSGIVVAVVDTGVEWTHSDLDDNIWSNPGEVLDGTDTDGNGFIDDIRGWDFTTCTDIDDFSGTCASENLKNPDNNPLDVTGHGTAVAGVAAAEANNTTGTAGVAPSAQIMPLKVFDDDPGPFQTGFTDWFFDALTYAAFNGADVINNSWGCSGGCDPTLDTAIQTAFGLGVVVVQSAGNSSDDFTGSNPEALDETLAVTATDDDDVAASFTSFSTTDADVAAPGVDIPSTWVNNSNIVINGTSFSAPTVSGVAALVLAQHGTLGLTVDQIYDLIRDTSDDIGDPTLGAGRLNANEAMTLTKLSPVLAAIGDQSVFDTFALNIAVSATDPNGDTLTISGSLVGGAEVTTIGAVFTDNGNNTASFSWTPSGQAGLDPQIVFTATDQVGFFDSETITVTVNTAPTCGNSTIEFSEECDDGNLVDGDGCSSMCENELCGDGNIDFMEECDDGNNDAGDTCGPTCLTEACGNGFLDPGEQCDDGGFAAGDGCDPLCQNESCGDGIEDPSEECDDGNNTAGDNCSPTCQDEVCGNFIVDPGETCDDGNTTAGDGCSGVCVVEFCGDMVVNNTTEVCDNDAFPPTAGDGCSADCLSDETCSNGITDTAVGEECDDGNTTAGDGCDAACLNEGCGDGIVNNAPNEECDDGNAVDDDACADACTLNIVGNGRLDPGEECEDGNTTAGDGCDASGQNEYCGDGIVNNAGQEQCDNDVVAEGSTPVGGDTCSSFCLNEVCGNGVLDPGEDCDDLPLGIGTGCRPDCTEEICGDGIVDPDEECDDGSIVGDDGCESCRFELFCGDGLCSVTAEGETCANCSVDCGVCRGIRPR